KQVIAEDGQLKRDILSKIVFSDLEKRKKLESFIHPRIHEEFVKQVESIAKKEPAAIIQVVIPLLIESNLQYMFHNLVVVYTSRDEQFTRLMKREGITKEEAENMLRAQLPIEEKKGYADYIINNEKSIDETRKQVEKLWETLKNK
ncbi:MAG TPA: dephospho-CoA kinase, partial [Desulfobacteraceae bacterium]|nr:dephospho-CoA kinase [Desulfobacteraceae bacterium]